jgi:hypothetical protein
VFQGLQALQPSPPQQDDAAAAAALGMDDGVGPQLQLESPTAAKKRFNDEASVDFFLMTKRMFSGKGLPEMDCKTLLSHLDKFRGAMYHFKTVEGVKKYGQALQLQYDDGWLLTEVTVTRDDVRSLPQDCCIKVKTQLKSSA